jgi:ATP-dependent Clp endopeptidase proteolytic subunit ClpP
MISNGAAMRQLQNSRQDWYRISNKADDVAPEVFIYGEVGWDGVTADDLIRDLAAIDADALTVRINSPGGSVFGGVAIYNALRTHPAEVTVLVDSIAASVASVIAQAGDVRKMVQHSQMMIHEAQGIAIGAGSEIREYADLLDKQSDLISQIYADRSGKSAGVFRALMKAESWFTADEAVAEGLADDVLVPKKAEPDNTAPQLEDITATATEDLEEEAETTDTPQPVQFGDLFNRPNPLTHNPFAELFNKET